MKNGKECQIIVGNLLFFANKFLDIPIHNSKYMPWVPNGTLTNDGNGPGITLWVRKILSCMISAKKHKNKKFKITWKFQADTMVSIFCFLVHHDSAINQNWV